MQLTEYNSIEKIIIGNLKYVLMMLLVTAKMLVITAKMLFMKVSSTAQQNAQHCAILSPALRNLICMLLAAKSRLFISIGMLFIK